MPRIRRCRFKGCHSPAYMPNHYCQRHIKYEEEYRKKREQFAHRQHSHASQWRYNHITRYRNGTKSEQNRFYHSKQWKTMRTIALKRDYSLCQYCKALGKLTTGNVIDHVLPIERFPQHMKDMSNLVTCCRDCHYWKTRWEERYYGTGLHGKPTDNPPVKDIALIAKQSMQLKALKKPSERL